MLRITTDAIGVTMPDRLPDGATVRNWYGRFRRSAGAFLLGFVVLFNLYLIPGQAQGASPRLTDLVGVFLVAYLLFAIVQPGLRPATIALLAIAAFIPVLYGVIAAGGGFISEPPFSKTFFMGARWGLAIGFGYLMKQVADNAATSSALLWGLFTGAVGNAVVIFLQTAGLQETAIALGLASIDTAASWIHGVLRPSGMHGHANGSTAVVSIAVPIAFYFYWTGRLGSWIGGVALALLVGTSALSLSRGPVVATAFTLLVTGVKYYRVRATAPLLFSLAAIAVLFVAAFGPPGGWGRWIDEANTEGNLDGRFETVLVTAECLLANPFGVGAVRAIELIGQLTGIASTHNALLSMTLVYGLPFGFILVTVFLTNIVNGGLLSDRPDIAMLLSIHLLLLFFLEDLMYLPTFVSLFGWMVAEAGARLFSTDAPHPAPDASNFRGDWMPTANHGPSDEVLPADTKSRAFQTADANQ
jgi:hypothetical protein